MDVIGLDLVAIARLVGGHQPEGSTTQHPSRVEAVLKLLRSKQEQISDGAAEWKSAG